MHHLLSELDGDVIRWLDAEVEHSTDSVGDQVDGEMILLGTK